MVYHKHLEMREMVGLYDYSTRDMISMMLTKKKSYNEKKKVKESQQNIAVWSHLLLFHQCQKKVV